MSISVCLYIIIYISINTQVVIQNRALLLARYLGLSADNHLDGQMAASSRFTTVSEDDFALKYFFFLLFFEMITCVFILKQLFASGSMIISEYSPIITSPSANNC